MQPQSDPTIRLLNIYSLCGWLGMDIEQLDEIARDPATKFPRPTFTKAGMLWRESDLLAWVSWVADRADFAAHGFDPAEVGEPNYQPCEG